MHFFTNDGGGNQMMYVNLFWAWGHPAVALILPRPASLSEVVATFSARAVQLPLDGLVTLGICVLSFMAGPLHHFFSHMKWR